MLYLTRVPGNIGSAESVGEGLRAHGEVEFEFQDGDEGGGVFMACGKVLGLLRTHLAHGRIDEAAALIASCTENVADELISDVMVGGPTKQRIQAITEMFMRAKDFRRAALCAEKGGDAETTARLLEQNYDLVRAAEFYQLAGQTPKAASLLERSGNHSRAAELFVQSKNYGRAAENLERAGKMFEAAQLYAHLRQWDKTVESLRRVPEESPNYPQAVRLQGQILEGSGSEVAAMQCYLQLVHVRRPNAETIDIYVRLAELSAKKGLMPQCRRLVVAAMAFDPNHAGALQLSRQYFGDMNVARETNEHIPIAVDSKVFMKKPLALQPPPAVGAPLDMEGVVPAPGSPDRLVGIDRDFEFLRQVPLFSQLSLDELRLVQRVCEKVRFATATPLLLQGRPGMALYVLIRGRVKVTSTGPDGASTTLVQLGPGAHVGEMSLVDDGPTSANVIAQDEVVAFRLARERLHELLEANERVQLRVFGAMVAELSSRLREANNKLGTASRGGPPPMPPG